ncbi:MAG: hypothetical protein R3F34_17690, partial [Planctomycetota bacterium]
PEGGDGGGCVVATGTPDAIAREGATATAPFLARGRAAVSATRRESDGDIGDGSTKNTKGKKRSRRAATGGGVER